jgi:hypothetical protein
MMVTRLISHALTDSAHLLVSLTLTNGLVPAGAAKFAGTAKLAVTPVSLGIKPATKVLVARVRGKSKGPSRKFW